MEPTITIEVITPAKAADYLKQNKNNRNIRLKNVQTLAKDMKEGRWVLTTDGIGFDTEGRLINGQHRLTACIEANIPFICAVFRNMPTMSFKATDNGLGRTASDAIKEVTNASTVASSIKSLTRIRQGINFIGDKATKNIGLSNSLSTEIYRSDEAGFNKATEIARSFINKNQYINAFRPGLLAGLVYYLIYDLGHDQEQVRGFFENILSLQTSKNETLELFRLRLISDAMSPVKLTAQVKQNMLAKVWNAYIKGKTLKIIKWDSRREGDVQFL
jgi:hypothetical protein